MLLTSLITMPPSTNAINYVQFVEVQPFNHQSGIYYENLGQAKITSNEWKWYVYYDMAEYWYLLKMIQKGIHKLDTLMKVITNRDYGKAIVSHYQQTIAELERTNELLLSHHGLQINRRNKRGLINVVGNVANKLFGILDEEYAAEVSQTIQKVQNNENHLLQLLKDQTSIIEGTEAIMKKSEKERGEQMKAIENAFHENYDKIRNLTSNLKDQEASSLFLSLAVYVSLLISEYQQTQATLIDTITDVHNGKMNTRIMSADKLRSQISTITEHLPSSLSIPTRDIAQLYQLMNVKYGITKEYTMFLVQLPLTLNTQFELYRLIPLPTLINGVYVSITPSTELLMINLQRDIFYLLSFIEFSKCITTEQGIYLCRQTRPIYNRDADMIRCEAEMINSQKIAETCKLTVSKPAKRWIQLSNPNNWLFALDNEYTYNIVCDNLAFQKTLRGSGLLKFHKRCFMKDADVTINSHSSYQSTTNTTLTTFQPTINLTKEISLPQGLEIQEHDQLIIPFRNHTEELKQVNEGIIKLRKQEESVQGLGVHDIHQYSIGYTSLAVTIVIGLCLGWIYCKLKPTSFKIGSTTQPRNISIELKPTPKPRSISQPTLSAEDFRIEVRNFKEAEDVNA